MTNNLTDRMKKYADYVEFMNGIDCGGTPAKMFTDLQAAVECIKVMREALENIKKRNSTPDESGATASFSDFQDAAAVIKRADELLGAL